MSKRLPNVIYVLADDLGWAEPGCYGNTYNETPNIDALADDGVRFTTAYASAPVCSPSRAGFLTGQTPARNGITDYLRPTSEWYLPLNPEFTAYADNELPVDTDYHMDPNMVTLAQMFKKKGYNTGIIGKWHLSGYDENGVKYGPDKYGFDEVIISEQVDIWGGSYFHPYDHVDLRVEPVLGEHEYLVDRMNYEAVEYIKRNQDKPFFLYLSHYAVHTTLVGKEDYVEHFRNKATDRPLADELEWTNKHNPVLAAMLKSIDDGVGMIVRQLEELGLRDDTIIVFTSDNGGETRVTQNGHLRGGKSETYEGGLRVSLVVSWKGHFPENTVVDTPTINLDMYPTFADIVDYQVPAEHILDGKSILPLLMDPSCPMADEPREFCWHYPLKEKHFLGGRSSSATRLGDYKLVEFLDDATAELYNLRTDESETTDISEQEAAQLKRQHERLMAWVDEVDGEVPAGQSYPEV